MNVLIIGGTGFIGSILTDRLFRDAHEVCLLIRNKDAGPAVLQGVSFIQGDPTVRGPWQQMLRNYDAIINLAGASIFSQWTPQQKQAIRESRVSTTRNIVEAIGSSQSPSVTLLSASAVGYYGFHGDEELTEESPPGNDFLATVAQEWEEEALKARQKEARVCLMRLGIVLGTRGGALSQMIPLFNKCVGGPIGNGKQWFSWVHATDLAEAFSFLLKHPELSGAFNVCSPKPVTNRGLSKALGTALHRPSFMPAPGFMVRWVLGEFGSVLLNGQRVIPRRLMASGFVFKYQEIGQALAEIVTP